MTTAEQVINCSADSWYPKFKAFSFRSRILPLPKDFVDYLVQDGVYLPEGNSALPKRASPDQSALEDEYRDWSDEDSSDSHEHAQQARQFPDVQASIQQAIEALGGSVIPKLNWSCPKDATWVTASNSLKCSNADEVLLLLKSSDRAAHDICNAFDGCRGNAPKDMNYVLVLKKYYDLKPEREFRCFVKGHDLIGVSQRDVTQHYPALADEADELEETILEFFEEHVQHAFPHPDYTMDVYVATNGKIKLMDFNPVGGSTAPLLFDWEELSYDAGQDQNGPELGMQRQATAAHATHDMAVRRNSDVASAKPLDFRILTEPIAMRPNKGAYGVPYDLVDTSDGSAMSEMLQQLQEADNALSAMNFMNQGTKPEE